MRMVTSGMLAMLLATGASAAAQAPVASMDMSRIQARAAECARQARSQDSPSAEDIRRVITCATAVSAEEINRQLPLRVDELTVLTRVEAQGMNLTYFQTVAVPLAQVTPETRQAVIESTRRNVCGAPDMALTIQRGGSYRYVWADQSGQVIAETRIASC